MQFLILILILFITFCHNVAHKAITKGQDKLFFLYFINNQLIQKQKQLTVM